MNIVDQVCEYINKYEEREPIFIKDLEVPPEFRDSRGHAIQKLIQKGIIKQYSRGIYYKPQKTMFGELGVDKEKLILYKYILQKDGNIEGYITGPTIWYNLNITTQVPNRKWIVTNKAKRNIENKELNIKLIKPKMKINKDIVKYSEILDIIEQYKMIQDIDLKHYNDYILGKLLDYSYEDINSIKNIVKNYNKKVINIFGFYLELFIKISENKNNAIVIDGKEVEYKFNDRYKNEQLRRLALMVGELKNSVSKNEKYSYEAIDNNLKREWRLY